MNIGKGVVRILAMFVITIFWASLPAMSQSDATLRPSASECEDLLNRPASGAYLSRFKGLCGPAPLLQTTAPQSESPEFVVGPNELVNVGDPGGAHPAETQSEPHVAVRLSDGLICSAFNDDQHGAIFTGFSRRPPPAGPWTHPGPIPIGAPFTNFSGDPVVTVDITGSFNVAHMGDTAAGAVIAVAVSRSPDCNSGWLHANASPLGGAVAGDVDKPWISADLRAGVAPAGNLYVCWTDMSAAAPPGGRILASTGPAGGPFAAPVVIGTPPAGREVNGCQVAVDQGSGAVRFAWWEATLAAGEGAPSLWFNSCGPGLAGCGVQALAVGGIAPIGAVVAGCAPAIGRNLNFAGNANAIRVQEFPAIAINQLTGHVYLSWNANNGGDPDIYFAAWAPGAGLPPAAPVIGLLTVNRAPGAFATSQSNPVANEQFMPAMAWKATPGPLGEIKITYYNRVGAVAPGWLEFWDAVAPAHGVAGTWVNLVVSIGAGVPFNVPPTNPNFDPGISNCYMGDYNGITADLKDFHIVWGDNRLVAAAGTPHLGHADPNVYYAPQFDTPTVSTWGIAVMTLLVLSAATILIRGRKEVQLT